jgi:hypothetical protein
MGALPPSASGRLPRGILGQMKGGRPASERRNTTAMGPLIARLN